MPDPTATDRFRLKGVFAEKSILIRSADACRYVRLTPRRQALAFSLGAGLLLWASASTGLLLVEAFERADDRAALREARALYETRLEALSAALADAATARETAEQRAREALAELAARHEALTDALTAARAAETRLGAVESEIAEARAARIEAEAAKAAAAADVAEAEAALARAEADRADLADTLIKVAEALDQAALARDDAQAESAEMRSAFGALESSVEERRDAQARVLAQLEAAAEASIGPLESVLRGAGVDVDAVLRALRAGDDGAGGPFVPAPEGALPLPPDEKAAIVEVMSDLERVTLLRAAVKRMPFGKPVTRAHRVTSVFGVRRDPVNGRRGMHEGIDLAAARGTPVMSAAEGVVTFAGRMAGYGNVVKIRHAFGFETVYAHLDRIRVGVGRSVRQGVRIGDMGNTGRSTGTHLHYEVRVNGKPVNPRKFIEAARHVDVL